jgi:MtN3 and saliva related transmembrane protein
MEPVTVVGLAAGALTTVALVPQFLKAWRTRSTRDVSLGSYSILAAGVFLWLWYGLAIGDLPLIAANAASLLLSCGVIALKLRHG